MRCPGRSPAPVLRQADAAPLNLPGRRHLDRGAVEQPSWAVRSTSLDADFFAYGGGSLSAAQLVSALRVRYPTITVADIYATPRVGALVELARQSRPDGSLPARPGNGTVRPTARKSQVFQTLMGVPLHILVGMRWLTYLMAANNVLAGGAGLLAAPTVSWWWVAAVVAGVRQPGRPDAAVGGRSPVPAARRRARHVSALRPGPPPALAGRADPGPGRRHQPGQRAVGALLRPGPRREDRPGRPAALAAAGDRAADAGPGRQRGAGGGSVRVVDRRRPRPHRRRSGSVPAPRWAPAAR